MKKLIATLAIIPIGLALGGMAFAAEQRSPDEIRATNDWTERLLEEELERMRAALYEEQPYVILPEDGERAVRVHPIIEIVPVVWEVEEPRR